MVADGFARDLPEVVVKRRRGISAVWAVPLVAAAIGAFLAYSAYASRGPSVTIAFATAEGLEAGKTRLRYLDVDMGVVERVAIAPDRRHVIATARLAPEGADYLRAGTAFWVVKPRVGVGGISGLGTLVSGAYVGMAPGEGPATEHFTGLEEPPPISANVAGRAYVLTSASLGSASQGTPIFYRGIEVGQVLGHSLGTTADELLITIFVKEPYDELVRTTTRFWSASGVRASAGADGFDIEIGSLQALLAGGIAFETLPGAPGAPAAAQASFPLYGSERSAIEARYTLKVPYLVYFDGSVRGLDVGAPVEFRGLRIGSVAEVRLDFDPASDRIRIPVMLEIEPQRLLGDIAPAQMEREKHQHMAQLVRRGLRAQLKSGSLLTGELVIDLVLLPQAPAAELDTSGPVPVLPSVPNTLDELQASVSRILDTIAKLPLDQLVTSLAGTATKVEDLVGSPGVQDAVEALGPALVQLQSTLGKVDQDASPLLASLKHAADTAVVTLRDTQTTMSSIRGTIGPQSTMAGDVEDLLQELTRAAQSIRSFANYLDRHPEALIRGRLGAAQ